MAVTKHGTQTLPASAPVESREWVVGMGETITQEWPLGAKDDILAAYELLKAEADAGSGNVAQLSYRNQKGRAQLIARLGRSGNAIPGEPADVTIIEELYAQDKIVPIWEMPYFDGLADYEIAWVRECAENMLANETDIDTLAAKTGRAGAASFSAWSALMRELHYHLIRGKEEGLITEFILRRSMYGVKTSQIKAPFTDINTVVDAPVFKSSMDALILALPDGEWMYRPPQAEHLGRGRWRVTREWHWSDTWSKVYGGTWGVPA